MVVFIVSPEYISHSQAMVVNAFEVTGISENPASTTDGRLERDIPKHLERFREAPVLGYGYDVKWYSNMVEDGGLSANDVPLTAALGMFGILGVSLFLFVYLKLINVMFIAYRVLKIYVKNNIIWREAILFLILLAVLVAFITKFTINFMSLFSELITGKARVASFLNIAFFLAAKDLLIIRLKNYQ